MYKTAKSNPPEQRELRQELRNHTTPAEAVLWRYLKGGQVGGYKFRRQHGMGPYVMDFYCPSLHLCIELDGEAHNGYLENQRDDIRTRYLQENGITVLRYENKQVWQNVEGIIKEILKFAEDNKPPLPLLAKEGNLGHNGFSLQKECELSHKFSKGEGFKPQPLLTQGEESKA